MLGNIVPLILHLPSAAEGARPSVGILESWLDLRLVLLVVPLLPRKCFDKIVAVVDRMIGCPVRRVW